MPESFDSVLSSDSDGETVSFEIARYAREPRSQQLERATNCGTPDSIGTRSASVSSDSINSSGTASSIVQSDTCNIEKVPIASTSLECCNGSLPRLHVSLPETLSREISSSVTYCGSSQASIGTSVPVSSEGTVPLTNSSLAQHTRTKSVDKTIAQAERTSSSPSPKERGDTDNFNGHNVASDSPLPKILAKESRKAAHSMLEGAYVGTENGTPKLVSKETFEIQTRDTQNPGALMIVSNNLDDTFYVKIGTSFQNGNNEAQQKGEKKQLLPEVSYDAPSRDV